MQSSRRSALSLVILLVFALLPALARAQGVGEDPSPLVAFEDSLEVEAPFTAPPPALDDACYPQYPPALLPTSFNRVFRLYTSEAVLNGYGIAPGWTEAQFDTFARGIFDGDPQTTTDIFPRVWSYFCFSDLATAEDSVYIPVEGGAIDKLEIAPYHVWNFCPNDSCTGDNYCVTSRRFPEGFRYGTADRNTVWFPINPRTKVGCAQEHWGIYLLPPQEAADFGGFAHEIQHVAGSANPKGSGHADGEFLSTAAEYVGGVRWTNHREMRDLNDGLYNSMAGWHPERSDHYNLYRLWSAYLFGHFSGNPSDITDDLLYKVIRHVPPGETTVVSSLFGMGQVLVSDFPDSVPGSTAAEKMGALYHRFAMARFADDPTWPGGFLGFGTSEVSPRNFAWFEAPDTCIERVTWMPPDVTCGEDLVGAAPVTFSSWTDPLETVAEYQDRSRNLELRVFGSEYFVFRADETYFGGADPQTLNVRIFGQEGVPVGYTVKIGVLEYADGSGDLFDQSVFRLREAIPMTGPDGVLDETIQVEDFGDSTMAAVVVVSLVQDPLAVPWLDPTLVHITVSYGYAPSTTLVGQDEPTIGEAILVTSPGGVVLVPGKAAGEAYSEALRLKTGVRVVGIDTGYGFPILNAPVDSATAVTFPSTAGSSTAIENFTIRGADQGLVRLTGQGQLKNCTLEAPSSTVPFYGVHVDTSLSGGAISGCTITLGEGNAVEGDSLSSLLVACTLDVDEGNGIAITGLAGVIAQCDVTVGTGDGIEFDHGTADISACTLEIEDGTGLVLRNNVASAVEGCTIAVTSGKGAEIDGGNCVLNDCALAVGSGKGLHVVTGTPSLNGGSITLTAGIGILVDTGSVSLGGHELTVGQGTGLYVVSGGSSVDYSEIQVDEGVGLRLAGSAHATSCDVNVNTGVGVQLAGGSPYLGRLCRIRVASGDSTNIGVVIDSLTAPGIVDSCLILVPGGLGADLRTANCWIYKCTLDSVAVGVRSVSAGQVANCVVGEHSSSGFVGATVDYCLADAPSAFGPNDEAKGTGCSAEDPLFCGPGEYTLRIDSFGCPARNPSGERIGAFDPACLFGEIVRSTTYDGPVDVTGDVTIPTSRSIQLSAGAALRISPTDALHAGADTAAVEIVVRGFLYLTGSAGDPLALASTAAAPQSGDWYGLVVEDGGRLAADHVDIRYSKYGVRFVDSWSAASHVRDSYFAENQICDLMTSASIEANCEPDAQVALSIEDNILDVSGSRGMNFNGNPSGILVSGNEIRAVNTLAEGIRIIACEDPSITLEANTISGFTAGTGIRVDGGGPTLVSNDVSDSKYGILVTGGSPVIGLQNDSDSDNLLHHNTNGLRCAGSLATPIVRNSQFHDNSGSGVLVAKGSGAPDLGPLGGADGLNSFYDNALCVRNGSTQGVSACGNWWGSCVAPACNVGVVITNNWKCTQPASSRRPEIAVVEQAAKTMRLLGAWPNPARGEMQLGFALEDGYGDVGIQVFDIAGRLVRTMPIERFGSGEHRVRWDGRNGAGQAVGTGVYFVRITSNDQRLGVVRVLMLH